MIRPVLIKMRFFQQSSPLEIIQRQGQACPPPARPMLPQAPIWDQTTSFFPGPLHVGQVTVKLPDFLTKVRSSGFLKVSRSARTYNQQTLKIWYRLAKLAAEVGSVLAPWMTPIGETQGQADRQFLESPWQQTFELLARNKANESATLKGQNKTNWFSQDLAMCEWNEQS
jgi:hypothetical protein